MIHKRFLTPSMVLVILCSMFLFVTTVFAQESSLDDKEQSSVEDKYELDTSHTFLRQGLYGENVKELQIKLRKLEYLDFWKYRLDGVFGDGTKQALIKFQKDNHLKPDGIYGPQTKSVLERKIAEAQNNELTYALSSGGTSEEVHQKGTIILSFFSQFILKALKEGRISEEVAEKLSLAIADKIPTGVEGKTFADEVKQLKIDSVNSAVISLMNRLHTEMELDVIPQSGLYQNTENISDKIQAIMETIEKITKSPVEITSDGWSYVAEVMISDTSYYCVDHLGFSGEVSQRHASPDLKCNQ